MKTRKYLTSTQKYKNKIKPKQWHFLKTKHFKNDCISLQVVS